ncbi:hypothetical protein [Micromonospora sp. NPDC005707]|uniref:hypothetical protein n=1 Tax=Micromonospora sp. NPDC005707 TaxID=3157050 RepID=UPI0034048C49
MSTVNGPVRLLVVMMFALTPGLLAGCQQDQPSGSTEPDTQVSAEESPEQQKITEVTYGQSIRLTTSEGEVDYVVHKPKVVVYHAAEYDADSKTATKPGAAMDPVVRVRVEIKGVSGEVATGAEISLIYEQSDGALASETLPLMTFEETDPLSNHPTTLSQGQKTAGEICFESADDAGKVIASSGGERQAVWRG